MQNSPPRAGTPEDAAHALRLYVADLELEVDRLRKRSQFVELEVKTALKRVHSLWREVSDRSSALDSVQEIARELAEMMTDLQEPRGYHPAHDQVIGIPLRPLVEQVFRLHQRLEGAPDIELRLELGSEHLEWFPARLRHVLENLVSNSMRYRDPAKPARWVRVEFHATPDTYQFRVSDNGLGLSGEAKDHLSALVSRAAPARDAIPGVGLAVVRLLVEGSGGTLSVSSGEGQGSTFVLTLPRYDLEDFLT
jgi:signal transduction histidine kinase